MKALYFVGIDVSKLTLDVAIVYKKDIIANLKIANTKAAIKKLVHPSGSLRPSRAYEQLTVKIKEAARFLDIEVLDHVIITAEEHYSFAEEGLLYPFFYFASRSGFLFQTSLIYMPKIWSGIVIFIRSFYLYEVTIFIVKFKIVLNEKTKKLYPGSNFCPLSNPKISTFKTTA